MHITEEGFRRSEELGRIEREAFKKLMECKDTPAQAKAYEAWREARNAEKEFNDSLGIIEGE